MSNISFDTTKEDAALISKITQRAVTEVKGISLSELKQHGFSVLDVEMDITAVHCNDQKLRLEALASADPFNFAHDIAGIITHIDRSTGTLTDCFVPRFAA